MISVIRSLLCIVCFAVFMFGSVLLSFVALPYIMLTRREYSRRRHSFSSAVKASWRFFVGLMQFFRLLKVDVSMEDGVNPADFQGSIVVANHPSLIDVVILASIVPSPVCVAKVSLSRLFFLRPIIENFCITNDMPAEDFIYECRRALEAGHNIIIFPEGTRSVPGESPKYHRGFAHAALGTAAAIMPVHIAVSEQILGKHQKFYYVSDKEVHYGIFFKQALSITAEDYESSHAVAARRVVEKMKLAIE